IDDKLYIPGIDARDDWSYGNFYVRSASDPTWVKYRTIPGGLHVFDLYAFSDPLGPAVPRKLFAGIGTLDTTNPMISLNGLGTAGSWSTSTLNGGPGATWRIYRLFELGGRLYGSSPASEGHLLYRYEGGIDFSQVPTSLANRMFPDQVDSAGNTTVAP